MGSHRSGRNRGSFNRKGLNKLGGIGSLEEVLLALASSQAVLGMTDRQLEVASGVPFGVIGRLRQGRGFPTCLWKITNYLESRLVG